MKNEAKSKRRATANLARNFNLPISWRIAIYVLLPVSFVGLFLLGLYGDKVGFWAARPFATNIFTATTSACAGIPVAVGIIQRIIVIQDRNRQRRVTQRTLLASVSQMREAILGFYDGPVGPLEDFSSLVRYCSRRSPQLLPFYLHSDTRELPTRELREELERFRLEILQVRSCAEELLSVDKNRIQTLQVMYLTAWESIDQQVRPQILEAEMNWLPRESYLTLRSEGIAWPDKSDVLLATSAIIDEIDRRINAVSTFEIVSGPDEHLLTRIANEIDRYLSIRAQLPAIEAIGTIH